MAVNHLFVLCYPHLCFPSLCISFECYSSVVCTCITFLFNLSLSPSIFFQNPQLQWKSENTETLCMNRASFLQETQTVFLASKVQNNLGPSGQQNLYYLPVSPVRPALTHPHAFTLAWSNSGLSIHLKENFSVFQSADKSLSVHARTMNVDSRERLRFCPGKFMLVHVRGLKLKDKFHCKPHGHGK